MLCNGGRVREEASCNGGCAPEVGWEVRPVCKGGEGCCEGKALLSKVNWVMLVVG